MYCLRGGTCGYVIRKLWVLSKAQNRVLLIFFFNSVVLQSFVIDVKCYILVVVAAIKD